MADKIDPDFISGGGGTLKIFQPVMKDPGDQLGYILNQIQAIQNPTQPTLEDYHQMADPSNPFVNVSSGRAEVTIMENMQAANSTTPVLPKDDSGRTLLLAGIGLVSIVYFLFLKGR